MPLFKLWNNTRSLKKCVLAKTLEELKQKGCEKLGVSGDVLIVTSNDGTEIDEDETLLEFGQLAEVLLLLRKDETWIPPIPVTPTEVDETFSQKTASLDIPKQTEKPEDEIVIQEDRGQVLPSLPSTSKSEETVIKTPSNVAQLIRSEELPRYSELVLRHLRAGSPEIIWNKLINETAEHYFGKYLHINESGHYKTIGEKVYTAWPCIRMEGTHPWTTFTRQLSMRIRHMIHGAKIKSQPVTSTPPRKTPMKIFISPMREVGKTLSEEDIKAHVKELKDEWKKTKKTRNVTHVKMLLKETVEYRDRMLKKSETLISGVLEEFPCFTDALFLLCEFKARFGTEKMVSLSQNMKRIVVAYHKLMGKEISEVPKEEDSKAMVEVVRFLEKETKFDRSGKAANASSHFKTLIQVHDDVADSEVDKKLATKPMEAPHIIVFTKDETLTGMYIVGDGCKIRCQGSSVTSSVLQLVTLYYNFDIEYPKCYAMALGLLQQFGFGEPYTYQTSKKYKFFVKRFSPVFECTEL